MPGANYLLVAVLILLLLPVVVLPWEGRRVPALLYAVIAGIGILTAGVEGGAPAMLCAAITGTAVLVILAALATAMRQRLQLVIITSGHMRLLAAGATWLGAWGTLAMAVITFLVLLAVAMFQHLRSAGRRPDFSAIAALAILCVSIQQATPDKPDLHHLASNARHGR